MKPINEANEEEYEYGPCPKCESIGHPGTSREPGQFGRTRCGSCGVATMNRRWPDFEVNLSQAEMSALEAKRLAMIGMAVLSAADIPRLSELAQVAANGDEGSVAQAYACIVAGVALERVDKSRAVRKLVNAAMTTPVGDA